MAPLATNLTNHVKAKGRSIKPSEQNNYKPLCVNSTFREVQPLVQVCSSQPCTKGREVKENKKKSGAETSGTNAPRHTATHTYDRKNRAA